MSDRIELARMAFVQLNKTERREFLRSFAPHVPVPAAPSETVPSILTRIQTAERLAHSPRFVDRLAQNGILHKVRLPGRVRCSGFRAADVAALIAGGKP